MSGSPKLSPFQVSSSNGNPKVVPISSLEIKREPPEVISTEITSEFPFYRFAEPLNFGIKLGDAGFLSLFFPLPLVERSILSPFFSFFPIDFYERVLC